MMLEVVKWGNTQPLQQERIPVSRFSLGNLLKNVVVFLSCNCCCKSWSVMRCEYFYEVKITSSNQRGVQSEHRERERHWDDPLLWCPGWRCEVRGRKNGGREGGREGALPSPGGRPARGAWGSTWLTVFWCGATQSQSSPSRSVRSKDIITSPAVSPGPGAVRARLPGSVW